MVGKIMAAKFDVIYPSNNRIKLDGGLNNKFDKQIFLDNESPDCKNVIFSDGSVVTRPGTTKLNTTSVGTFACDGLYTRHANNGAESMCAWFGGSLYTLGATTFTAVASAV
jgi:hypothetical protein